MSKLNLTWHTETPKQLKEPEQPTATLTTSAIKLNSTSLSLLANPERVVFAHDSSANIIAVKAFIPSENNDLSRVTYSADKFLKDGSVTIRAKDFMEKIKSEMQLSIEGKEKLLCSASYDGRRKLLLIQVPVAESKESIYNEELDASNYKEVI